MDFSDNPFFCSRPSVRPTGFGGFPPYSPEPPVQHSKQPLTAPVKKSSASPKLVQIPVHFVGSEASRSEPQYRSASALKIQKVFRGFLVRRSMKKITAIRRDVDEIERRISQSEALELMRRDDRERLRVNEMLMALLFKLDSVRGVDSGVRDFRRFVTKKAIALQERLDAIVPAVVDQTKIQISSELKDDSQQSGDAEAQTLESAAPDAGEGKVSVDAPNSENSGDNCGRVEEQNPPQESADGLCEAQESADHFELKVDRENCVENGVDNNFIMVEVDSGTRGEEEVLCVDKENCDSDYNILSMDERGDESPVRNDANDVSDSVNHVEEMPEEENEKEKTDNNKRNQELMEKMIEDNQKMMNMMSQLCEKNEKQTKMLNALTKRVEQLEKAYVCHILRRKKGRHSD